MDCLAKDSSEEFDGSDMKSVVGLDMGVIVETHRDGVGDKDLSDDQSSTSVEEIVTCPQVSLPAPDGETNTNGLDREVEDVAALVSEIELEHNYCISYKEIDGDSILDGCNSEDTDTECRTAANDSDDEEDTLEYQDNSDDSDYEEESEDDDLEYDDDSDDSDYVYGSNGEKKKKKCKTGKKAKSEKPTEICKDRTNIHRKAYQCEVCGFICKYSHALVSHLKTHDPNYCVCTVCGKKCKSKSFYGHCRFAHAKSAPHQCDKCGKQFKYKEKLQHHLLTHSNIFPFHCKLCSFKTRQKSNLKIHERIHTGEKPYVCSECNYTTAYPGLLKNHRCSAKLKK